MSRERIASLLEMFFGTRSRFTPLPPRGVPSGAQIRELRTTDRAACLDLYKQNEPGRFPAGFEKEFAQFLDRPDYLKLACYLDEKPIAIGGIARVPTLRSHRAWLVFGMVQPEFHGRGVGTAMMLARLAALPKPSKPVRVMLSNVATSEGFFARFGFTHQGQMPASPGGPLIDVMAAMLDAAGWEKCRGLMGRLETMPETFAPVPALDVYRMPIG